ncbi:MAG TPA: membrane dipeptidase, partial [Bryobacteraceae bacterium]|nr:membrane dipeptidase [Bryobacteraceae bacterium]
IPVPPPSMWNRREFLRRGVFMPGAVLAAPMINRGRFQLFAGSKNEYSHRTIDLVRESIVIDMLGLVTLDWAKLERWQREPGAFKSSDFKKIQSSGISVFHPAVDLNTTDPYASIREWMRDWNVFLDSYPKQFLRIDCAADFELIKKQGKIGIILGLQNASHFRTIDDIDFFYRLGQRVSQLTYNSENSLGAGCGVAHDRGLTEYGEAAITRMNRIGMAVDVSHTGDCTTLDAIKASSKPVLITHSNCRALNPRHPRCKPDDIIRSMAARGGVMGITGIRGFVSRHEPATIEDVLNHFDHVAQIAGIEHLGIGSDNDLDGRDHYPAYHNMDISGLDHPQRIFDLTEGLLRRGYSDRNIRLILGGNFLRALDEIWTV